MASLTEPRTDILFLHRWRLIILVAVAFSFAFNVLRLSGPVFIILVHDHVLVSGSREKLVELFLLLALFLVVMGVMDYSRRRLLARLAAQFQERIEDCLFVLTVRQKFLLPGLRKPTKGLNEVDNLRGFLHSDTLVALLDFMWAPMFLVVVFYFHWMLGWTVISGLSGLLVLSLVKHKFANERREESRVARDEVNGLKDMILTSGGVIRSQDMSPGFNERWLLARRTSRDKSIALSDWNSWFGIFSRQIRILLQYSVLAIGAYLALNGELSVGAMVASMFLSVRVIVPVGQVIQDWPSVRRAVLNWNSLKAKICAKTKEAVRNHQDASDTQDGLCLRAVSTRSRLSGALLLKSIDLTIGPGMLVEINGESGSGKSVLARTIPGIHPKSSGTIQCGGVAIEALSPSMAQRIFGYVPASASLIRGTIEENIAGLAVHPDNEKILRAAHLAQIHDAIAQLPDAYKTKIDPADIPFSSGQQYRIALARALYHEPWLLIFDEPDSFLREDHGDILNKIMTETGSSVIVFSRERLDLIKPDKQYTLKDGILKLSGVDKNPRISQT